MSEVERRRAFFAGRVLIETGRVLDPQFDDSLLCLTGAELELLRNVTAYMHRPETFVDSYHDGYYIMPDDDDYDTLQAVVAGLEEKLMGCTEMEALLTSINGYLAGISFNVGLMHMEGSPIPANEAIAEQSDGSSPYYIEWTPPAEDYRMRVDALVAMNTSGDSSSIRFEFEKASSWRQIYSEAPVAGGGVVRWFGPITLEYGESLRVRFTDTDNLDNLRIIRWAERFEIP